MSIVSVIASAIGWSAVGQGVVMKVTDAADARLVGKALRAAITLIEQGWPNFSWPNPRWLAAK